MKKQLLRRFSQMKGFTMVELMIVIAIIGIIAVAVLSAINPIEQINKGNDTRRRSDASEMLNAMERYYATHELYPTMADTTAWDSATMSTDVAVAEDVASQLVDESELKAGFENRLGTGAGKSDLSINLGASIDQVQVCFRPASMQFKVEASKKCVDGASSIYPSGICDAAVSAADYSVYCMP